MKGKISWHTTWWGALTIAVVATVIATLILYFVFGIGKNEKLGNIPGSIQTFNQTGVINTINNGKKPVELKTSDKVYLDNLLATHKDIKNVNIFLPQGSSDANDFGQLIVSYLVDKGYNAYPSVVQGGSISDTRITLNFNPNWSIWELYIGLKNLESQSLSSVNK